MKKFLLSLLCTLFCALGASAQQTVSFPDNLYISVNDDVTGPIAATVDITLHDDGTIDFSLPNFHLVSDGVDIPVGNIDIKNIPLGAPEDGFYPIAYNGPLTITPGNDGSEEWLGPLLGELTLDLKGKVSLDKVYVTIDIDLTEELGQIIRVIFGDEGNSNVVAFQDNLYISVNDDVTGPIAATVDITLHDDGTIDFSLPNFHLVSDGVDIPVGNIDIKNIPLGAPEDGFYPIAYNGPLTITPGNDGSEEWLGPLLGELTLDLKGKVSEEKVYVTIDIDLTEELGQVIRVIFGDEGNSNVVAFQDKLFISVNNDVTGPIDATVSLTLNEDGTIDFSLPNFRLVGDGVDIPVGNIDIKNIPLGAPEEGFYPIAYNGPLTITPGNDASEEWLGPLLGELTLDLKGKVSEEKVYVTIDIDLTEELGQIIHVTFGYDSPIVVGLDTVLAQSAAAALYDLQGRRVLRPQGITVSAGRKMISK